MIIQLTYFRQCFVFTDKFSFYWLDLRGFRIGKIIEILHREHLDNVKIIRPMRKPLNSVPTFSSYHQPFLIPYQTSHPTINLPWFCTDHFSRLSTFPDSVPPISSHYQSFFILLSFFLHVLGGLRINVGRKTVKKEIEKKIGWKDPKRKKIIQSHSSVFTCPLPRPSRFVFVVVYPAGFDIQSVFWGRI